MQLQKRLNRKVGDTEYSKWVVVIPPETIDKLGWKEGEELIEQVNQNKLVLVPKSKLDSVELARFALRQRKRRQVEGDH